VDQRGTFNGKRAPGPFRCLGCQSFVTGTPSGHCPRCGFVPPVAMIFPDLHETDSTAWMMIALLVVSLVALVVYSF
jgi:hypothetical protein